MTQDVLRKPSHEMCEPVYEDIYVAPGNHPFGGPPEFYRSILVDTKPIERDSGDYVGRHRLTANWCWHLTMVDSGRRCGSFKLNLHGGAFS